jgi:hypothetical protein
MKRSSRPRSTATLSRPVQHQLNLYALSATAAGVGLLALAQPAEAKIVYTPTHQVIRYGNWANLDLNHDGITDFIVGVNLYVNFTSARLAAYYGNTSANTIRSYKGLADAYPRGIRVGPKKNRSRVRAPGQGPVGVLMEFVSCVSRCRSGGNWLNVKNRYLGLSFVIKGKTHYGWARLNASVTPSHQVRGVLTGYAYETIPGKAIITGKTKGPTVYPASLGHLAAGASAIPTWRSGK